MWHAAWLQVPTDGSVADSKSSLIGIVIATLVAVLLAAALTAVLVHNLRLRKRVQNLQKVWLHDVPLHHMMWLVLCILGTE